MKETKQNKQTNEGQEIQMTCSDVLCNSKRQQFLTILYSTKGYLLRFICMDCGMLNTLDLNGSVSFIESPEFKETKKEVNYLG